MSGFLTDTCTIYPLTQSIDDAGYATNDLGTPPTAVACSLQIDSSGESVQLRMQQGVLTARLYILATVSIDHDNKVTDSSSNEWRVVGPAYYAPGASTKWVPLERKVP